MAILNIQMEPTGLAAVVPSFIYIDTDDDIATVTTAGYLNGAKSDGFNFSGKQIAVVGTINAGVPIASLYYIAISAGGVITLSVYY